MQKRASIWSFAVGLAFFAMSLGIALPFAAALAGGNGAVSPALTEICSIGGVKLVSPSSTNVFPEKHVSKGHEYCPYCGFTNAPALTVPSLQIQPHLVVVTRPDLFWEETTRSEISELGLFIRAPPVLS